MSVNAVHLWILGIVVDSGARSSKRYYCPYCLRPQAKLPRHLASRHHGEAAVKEYLDCTDTHTKNLLLTRIRNLGNHWYNCSVLKSGTGVLNVVYRSKSNATDYSPCTFCLGYYPNSAISSHLKRCAHKTK